MSIPAVPATRRDDVVETLHGVEIVDPYRWLEDGASAETRAWTAAQNARTEAILSAVPGRVELEARLTELYRAGTVEMPAVRGQRFFYLKREGEQSQAVLYARDGLDGAERSLVDPNALDPNGLTALDWWYPSHDGGLVAYGTSQNGDEWSTLRVVDVATGAVRPDAIARTRYSSVAWLPDGSGFYYTRYPAPGTVPPGQEHYNSHAFFHRLGADPATDPKVFGEGRSPQDMLQLEISADGRRLVAIAAQGWVRSEVYLRDLSAEAAVWVPVATGLDARFDNPIATADRLYLRSNLDASNGCIVAVDPAAPAPANWTTIVPARDDRVLEGFVLAGGAIVTQELEAATSRLRVYALTGDERAELPLPVLGTVEALDGEPDNPVVVAGFASFAVPPSAFAFTVADGTRKPLAPVAAPPSLDPAAFDVRQVRYRSKDGTAISMFLVGRAGAPRDGQTPTILDGYGGFNIPRTPDYRPFFLDWIERGGMMAVANLRGGGEYGETWHRAGMLGNKQNVFDDFIAAAEWLIAEGYTSADRLATYGGSNGGLLVGATLTQRPELCRAVFCAVPLLDMLRYHHFSVAKLWIPEYGSADDPEAFRWLHAYSPYHHVERGRRYPAVLLTTAEQDSRVDPLHARKMAALLQWATAGDDDRPILLRAETAAGHGIGKPIRKRVAEAADVGCFLASQLGVDLESSA
jgi:prolyl oligopeptidase